MVKIFRKACGLLASFSFSHCFSSCCLTKLFNVAVGRHGSVIDLLSKPVKVTPETSVYCQISPGWDPWRAELRSLSLRLRLRDSFYSVVKQRAVSPSVSTSQADGLVNAVMELCKSCYRSHSWLSERRRTESYTGNQGCFTVVIH